MTTPPKILVVDDTPHNVKVLQALLAPQGYTVISAGSGQEALDRVMAEEPDLVLLDVVMPGMDGYEICKRLRDNPATRLLPVVMVTASDDRQKFKALELGADDLLSKPFDNLDLLARVKSLLRIKQYQETIQTQAAELAEWNRTLEARVRQQVEELNRLGRLRRFLSPQLAEVILSTGEDSLLASHRREITVVFCDLRGFTSFSETAEPEDVMGIVREYHSSMGEIIFRFEGTLERFTGDGLMVFFNDPVPVSDPAVRAVHMAVTMRERFNELSATWQKIGYQLGLGMGIAQGYATLGKIGFEGRFDYGATGTVVNLASRLCDAADTGQIMLSQRVFAGVEELVETERLTDLSLKGFLKPVPAFNVVRLRATSAQKAGHLT